MIKQLQQQINNYLGDALPKDCDQATLASAMRYSLMAGGKRLRPSLTLAVYSMTGGNITSPILRAACAVELIHTYSLIHDDLPAMDNDDLRRSKPTNHRRFGAGMATLAGDGLLTLAFQWLSDNDLPSNIKLQLVKELSIAAGPSGMVAGQAMDIHNEGHQLPLSILKRLHAKKTGALLRYSVLAGGIIAKLPSDQLDLLSEFGKSYGLAFQIYDDIMDVVGSEEEMGKAVHKDKDEQKNTYPNLLGLDGAKKQLNLVLTKAQSIQQQLATSISPNFKKLDEFLAYFK